MNHHLDQEVVAGFISEAKGYLPEIMLGLEAFAAAPDKGESIREAFRFAHIIKGAASMLGFHEISELAYQLEVRLEMLSEQQMELTQELLEELCQNVSDLSDLLETALNPKPAATAPTKDVAKDQPAPTPPTAASQITDFDFFFSSSSDLEGETGQAHLLKSPEAKSDTPSKMTAPFPQLKAEKEPGISSVLDDNHFSISLPEIADIPTVGDLNLTSVAAELKESFGNAPLPPQPEFQLPDELMSGMPEFEFAPKNTAEASEVNLLDVPENSLSEVPYDDLADNLANSLLSTALSPPAAQTSVSALEPIAALEPIGELPAPTFDTPTLRTDKIAPRVGETRRSFDSPLQLREAPTPTFDLPEPLTESPKPMFGLPELRLDTEEFDAETQTQSSLSTEEFEVKPKAGPEAADTEELTIDAQSEMPELLPLPELNLDAEEISAEAQTETAELLPLPELLSLPELSLNTDDAVAEPAFEAEEFAGEEQSDIPELLPLPELPELLVNVSPELESFMPLAASEETPEITNYDFDDLLLAAPIVETPDIPTSAGSLLSVELPEELLETFLLEAEEHLQVMHNALRALEKTPGDLESLLDMRRSAHSLKGTASLVGFRNIMQLAHRMEDLLDLVYKEKFRLTQEPTHLLMRATDMLEDMSNGQVNETALQQIYSDFDDALTNAKVETAIEAEPKGKAETGGELKTEAEPETAWEICEEPQQVCAEEQAEKRLPALELPTELLTQTSSIEMPGLAAEPAATATEAELLLPNFTEEIMLEGTVPDEATLSALTPFTELSDEFMELVTSPPMKPSAKPEEPIAETITEQTTQTTEAEPAPSLIEEINPILMTPPASETLPVIKMATPPLPIALPTIEVPTLPEAPSVIEATLSAIPEVPHVIEVETSATTVHPPVVEESPSSTATPPASKPKPVGEKASAATAQTNSLTQTTGQFLRVPIERLDEIVKLIGEMIITRTSFEQRLTDFARQVEELQIAGTRLRRASTNLESKYEASTLGGGKAVLAPGKAATAGREGKGLVGSLVTHNTHGFDDLEFDRYTEFHLVSRELVESSSDIQTVGREFAHINGDFLGYLNRQSRIYNELQDRLMRLRMVPLSSIAPRLHRAVRQVATQENKLVELILDGESTAIDTTALQELIDPLVHLLRNSVDHGIEMPDVRVAKGKSSTGQIKLRAFYEGSQVILQLSDDGKGLDSEKIRAKAIQAGLVNTTEAATMSDPELWALILTPGFSTASQVSEISGRGVGMDVVHTTVQKLKGTITIDSQPDAGVRFTIRLPLTLAVTRALMVKAHSQSFAIPLDVVTQIMRLDMSKVERIGKEPIIRVGGKIYPLLMLSRLLNLRQISDEIETRPPALLINVEGREVAVIVDQLMGGREIVIKTLGTHLRKVHGVMGATLMGSGDVVLILNLAELVRGTTRTVVRRTEALPPTPAVATEPVASVNEAIKPIAEPMGSSAPQLFTTSNTSKPENHPLTVMIVDDSPSVRRVSSNLIRNTGWIPLQAKDGLEALEKLQSGEAAPDLMMLDIEMPRMDGYQLLVSLRALPVFRQLPVIIVSSRSSEKHRQKAFDLGATDYLVKPYQEDHVLALIRQLVANKKL